MFRLGCKLVSSEIQLAGAIRSRRVFPAFLDYSGEFPFKKTPGLSPQWNPSFFGGPQRFLGSPPPAGILQPFAPGVTRIQVVPEFDVILVFLPAQKDLSAADNGGKIDQPALKVLDLDLPSVEFL